MTQPNPPLNVDALFLGPKAENRDFYKDMMAAAVDAHLFWRRDYFPQDSPEVDPNEAAQPDFTATLAGTQEVLRKLSATLRDQSVPWFSPRYLGHMDADTLMVANVAYLMTMLYNPNNVAHEASPATTQFELEAGQDLCRLFGYDTRRSWGHLTSGGHVANYEGMWVARNLATMPAAIAAHPNAQDLVQGLSDYARRMMPAARLLDLTDTLKGRGIFTEVRDLSARGVGADPDEIGKLLLPVSKHYSWEKAADVLGIGQANIVPIPVDHQCRMEIDALTQTVTDLMDAQTPILAVIAVIGSTEEGAVDPLAEIVALRQRMEAERGQSFYIHADAAFGGYIAAALVDDDGQYVPYDLLDSRYQGLGVFPVAGTVWPKREVYDAYRALGQVDSITCDPHKMGYVPYPAGGVCMKDRRILDLISYEAAYLAEDLSIEPDLSGKIQLGNAILEGSKAGAAASAVWAAHQVAPLNIAGYGQILGRSLGAAGWFYRQLATAPDFEVGGRRFSVRPFMDPDLNIVDFSFLEAGDASLDSHNRLNERMYELSSYFKGRTYDHPFNTSQTALTYDGYGDAPRPLVQQRGLSGDEWDRVHSITLLCSTVMTVVLKDSDRLQRYWDDLMGTWQGYLTQIVEEDLLAGTGTSTTTAP
ncbi:MAG: tyrosine decarboxylase [Bifidobacteriaceae bacterium]|jgi:tyrosine decarboxylase|nr:tyrosine decarboxylase [Bifidobacteriaceae bacterium]